MKVLLSGKCEANNIFGLSPNQFRYVVSRSKNPKLMYNYLMGNWFTSIVKSTVSNLSHLPLTVANVFVSNKKDVNYNDLKNAFPKSPINIAPKIAPKTTTIPEVNKIEIQNTIDKVVEKQKIEDIKAIESIKMYDETQNLLKKQVEDEKARLLFDNFIKDQLQEIDTSKVTSSFDFSKLVPYLAIAATIPFLLSGEK